MAFALDNRGGGNALPPYLQGRVPAAAGPFQTRPMITPKASIMPGETRKTPFDLIKQGTRATMPKITPKKAPANVNRLPGAAPAPAGGATPPAPVNPNQTIFDYGKQQLEDARKQAEADTTASAASRGVYYGTPLTTSLGDIKTQYLKGLGTLTANLADTEQNRKLQAAQIAAGLLNGAPMPQQNDMSSIFQSLGSLFPSGGQPGNQGSPADFQSIFRPGPLGNVPTPGVPTNLPVKLRGVTPKKVS